MSDIKKDAAALDLKAVAINPVKEASNIARPADDDPCSAYWCLRMKPEVLDFMSKINPADLAVLVDHGYIRVSELNKDLQSAIGSFANTALPADDCPGHWCIRMRGGINDYLDKINPGDLEVLVRHGFVRESMLTKAQQAALAEIRKK